MEQDITVSPYIVKFAIAYVIGIISISVVFIIFDLSHSTGASIGVLLAAAMYSVSLFIKENKRVPNKNEKSKMLWLSFLFSWVASLLIMLTAVAVLAGTQGLAEMYQFAIQLNMFIIVFPFIIISLLYIAVLNYSYGGLARKQFELLQKNGKI